MSFLHPLNNNYRQYLCKKHRKSRLIANHFKSICLNLKFTQMTAKDFSTTFMVDQSPEEVFNAVNNPRGWWSEKIDGRTDGVNAELIEKWSLQKK